VAVLAGALLVGDSVRGSLRDLVLQRLGLTDRVVVSTTFFREALADDLQRDPAFTNTFSGVVPIVAIEGLVSEQASRRRASRVQVYGVDERFWRFHHLPPPQGTDGRSAFLSAPLARDIGAKRSDTVLVRIERPSAVPIESLHGRKEDLGRTLRLTVREVLTPSALGEFSLRPQQGGVRAIFVPLRQLQEEVEQKTRVNVLLVSDQSQARGDSLPALLKQHATPEDIGLTVRGLEAQHAVAVESPAGLINAAQSADVDKAAATAGMTAGSVFTYLASAILSGDREVPYSLVTAIDLSSIVPSIANRPSRAHRPLLLNDWAARELNAQVGSPVSLEYYVWEEPGVLKTRSADFEVAAIVPIEGAAADRDFAPVYPGITEASTFSDWDPPFPIDLRKVRPVDETYWKTYRTTPKAFISLEDGQDLWRSRYGDRTSVRVLPRDGESTGDAAARFAAQLGAVIDPLALGFAVRNVRTEALAASRGATDFGEYFTYFSFFLVVSALLLASLFFKLGVEQRAREVGLLRAVGFTTARVRRLFALEGLLLAVVGSIVGMAGAVAYGALMMKGLGSWWSGAVGTSSLSLHVTVTSLAAGAIGAVVAAAACLWWTLRSLSRVSERSLLAGTIAEDVRGRRTGGAIFLAGAIAFGAIAAILATVAVAGRLDRTGTFFAAGSSMLLAGLCAIAYLLRRAPSEPITAASRWPTGRVGLRNTANRPGRSVLAIAVIASATFILISVDAFRRVPTASTDRRSGVGGYQLLVDLMVPLAHDPNAPAGHEAIGLETGEGLAIDPFRVLPGDETSCLNLYQPTNPRILGVTRGFIDSGRFAFASVADPNDAERANPWLTLNRDLGGGTVPIIADANSMTYVLHKSLGDEIAITRGDATIRLRLVAALNDSLFQGELLMSEANFLRLFPDQQGYRLLLVDTRPGQAPRLAATIEDRGSDLGADVTSTVDRLAEFHRVENTYLATFQALGGLGLLVGTIGLAAVLLRNVLERRRELALLRAVGYGPRHLFAIVLAENAALLACGLLVGVLSALVAIAPAAADRGARLPLSLPGGLLLVAVLAAGLLSSVIATRVALRTSLVGALRSE
jgi:ABC-type lipoprotein release transport system permease subunit